MSPLVAVLSIRRLPIARPYLTPAYELRLACGHVAIRRLSDGGLPKRWARCCECAS